MFNLNSDNTMLGYELMNSHPDIFCFSTTRHGGVGSGNYASFNCSPFSGDDAESVRRNREILLSHMPLDTTLIIPHQVHGVEVEAIDDRFAAIDEEQQRERLEGIDAIVTDRRGVCLCISTADCVPLLFYDKRLKVIGAAHAGWRGTLAGIALRTMETMATLYGCKAEDLSACIGPSISPESFEIGDEVYDAFAKAGFDMSRIAKLNSSTGKHHIDLWEANRQQMVGYGVKAENIETAGICTFINHNLFFSARRLGINSGRILTGIMIRQEEREL